MLWLSQGAIFGCAAADDWTLDWLSTAWLSYPTPQERKKLLSFGSVGGGPTGVEVAAELHDLITEDLVKLYPDQVRFRSWGLMKFT